MNAPATNADPVHLYQIAYSPATLAQLEPGYLLLDNLANPRPDWYEYGPIRRFLLQETLDEQAFYGFFSPKFGAKTGLGHAEVQAIVRSAAAAADVVLLSPHPNQIAFFLNVFEQGEFSHPGHMALCTEFLQGLGLKLALPNLVMDVQQMVYSNYFVARPAFWREWLKWNEALYSICEAPASPDGAHASLRDRLNTPTGYEGGTQHKIFVMERIAPLLLSIQPHWRVHAHNPFGQGWATEELRRDPSQALCCEALKQAFRKHGFPEFIQAFARVRRQVMGLPPL